MNPFSVPHNIYCFLLKVWTLCLEASLTLKVIKNNFNNANGVHFLCVDMPQYTRVHQ